MNVVAFKECNTIYAENQPEYLPLHCHRSEDGKVTSCWKLSVIERLKVVFFGKLYLQILTFNKPLQPLKMMGSKPVGKKINRLLQNIKAKLGL